MVLDKSGKPTSKLLRIDVDLLRFFNFKTFWYRYSPRKVAILELQSHQVIKLQFIQKFFFKRTNPLPKAFIPNEFLVSWRSKTSSRSLFHWRPWTFSEGLEAFAFAAPRNACVRWRFRGVGRMDRDTPKIYQMQDKLPTPPKQNIAGIEFVWNPKTPNSRKIELVLSRVHTLQVYLSRDVGTRSLNGLVMITG